MAALANASDEPTTREKEILKLALAHRFPDGGYTVVSPKTSLYSVLQAKGHDERKYISESLKADGVDVGALFDKLVARNKNGVSLSIASSPEEGYILDTEGKFSAYFNKDGGGWEKWYRDFPLAHGHTQISLPVFDERKSVVMIYKGTQSDWLAGAGWVILFSYVDGKLIELKKVMIWVS